MKKGKVFFKGIESAGIVTIIMVVVNLLDIKGIDEKAVSAIVVGLTGVYFAVKNWMKHK